VHNDKKGRRSRGSAGFWFRAVAESAAQAEPVIELADAVVPLLVRPVSRAARPGDGELALSDLFEEFREGMPEERLWRCRREGLAPFPAMADDLFERTAAREAVAVARPQREVHADLLAEERPEHFMAGDGSAGGRDVFGTEVLTDDVLKLGREVEARVAVFVHEVEENEGRLVVIRPGVCRYLPTVRLDGEAFNRDVGRFADEEEVGEFADVLCRMFRGETWDDDWCHGVPSVVEGQGNLPQDGRQSTVARIGPNVNIGSAYWPGVYTVQTTFLFSFL
jgi:hypothetical protein